MELGKQDPVCFWSMFNPTAGSAQVLSVDSSCNNVTRSLEGKDRGGGNVGTPWCGSGGTL
eukprot:scaffold18027_cov25-Tisochrysis_lutea.AAC.1